MNPTKQDGEEEKSMIEYQKCILRSTIISLPSIYSTMNLSPSTPWYPTCLGISESTVRILIVNS